MIEIADVSEVSRATLYNHYRDKDSVIRSLCESEMQRLVEIAQAAPDVTSALEQVSIEISADKALAAMRRQDPDFLTLALSAQSDTLWKAFAIAMGHLLGQEKGELATRWLIGQALHPINTTQSRTQAEAITSIAHL
jgi:AcrR family transcriptional regulator